MSFRDKEKRRGPIDKRTTIDAVHQDRMNTYIDNENSIPFKKKELDDLKNEYDIFEQKQQIELSDTEIRRKLLIFDKMRVIEKEIILLAEKKDRTEYYLQNGHLIFQYYDSKSTDNSHQLENAPSASILNMFRLPEEEEVPKKKKEVQGKKISKTHILNQYMSYIDDEYIYSLNDKENEYCVKCGSDLFLMPVESILVCKECGLTEDIIINSDKPSYKDPPREVSYFAYKRINHFNEWLAQFQAKESTEIPEEVYDKIIKELSKEKIVSINTLTPDKLRDILKKLKYNKYYEHVPHIINHLNGVPAPSMSRNTEEKLRMMFKEIQTPFVKYCPKERKNFLSYSYVLHKFCELLSMDEYLECFPLLKSREKLQQQDNIWEKICYDLQWQYIPST